MSLPMAHAIGGLIAFDLARGESAQSIIDRIHIVRMYDGSWGVTEHLVRLVAEHRATCWRNVGALQLQVQTGDHVACAVREKAVARLALAQLRLRAAALGYVAQKRNVAVRSAGLRIAQHSSRRLDPDLHSVRAAHPE